MKLEHVIYAFAALLAVLVCTAGLAVKQHRLIGEQEAYISYWRHQADSTSQAAHRLQMEVYDLKDSIITLKYGKED